MSNTSMLAKLKAQGRPRAMHPKTWLRVLARAEVSAIGAAGDNGFESSLIERQSFERRVSAVYHRLLREAGVHVEGA